ncbi:MAG: hypothetical protein ABFC84_00315 [Veillonellales bacterium]
MNVSRRERKREKIITRRSQFWANSIWILLATAVGLLWCNQYIFTFAMSMTVLLLGIVGINYANIRLFLPGLTSPFLFIRWSAALLYLLGIIIFISQVSIYTLLSCRP